MRPRLDARLCAMMALGTLTTATLAVGAAPAPAAQGAGSISRTAATTPAATTTPITLSIRDRSLRYGQRLSVSGRLRGAGAGREIVLEHGTRAGAWSAVARTVTRAGGTFRLRGAVARSGLVRVVAPAAGLSSAGGEVGGVPASRVRGVRVAATVAVARTRTNVRVGGRATVSGRVRPGTAGRVVRLQRRAGRGWVTLDRARTRAGGTFTLWHRARSSYSARLRVVTAAGSALAAGRAGAGRLNALRPSVASWYGEGQSLACGGHLTPGMMGVAHKTLPCGTMVTIRYRGRQVRVPVVDRGPYAGGREWDLGPGVRSALGFDGVGTVYVAH